MLVFGGFVERKPWEQFGRWVKRNFLISIRQSLLDFPVSSNKFLKSLKELCFNVRLMAFPPILGGRDVRGPFFSN